jgi:hypothetical protein
LHRNWFLFISFFLSVESIFGQLADSVHQYSNFPFANYSLLRNDSISGFHNDQFNTYQAPLGIPGTPVINLLYPGHSFQSLDATLFDTTLAPVFHKSSIPYTSAKYSLSSLKSQGLNLHHVQPIKKSIFAGLSYRNIRSEGEFQNQVIKSDWLNLHLTWMKGPHYKMSVFGIYYQLNREENGGISDDSLFLERIFRSSLYDVHLSQGTASYKRNWKTGLIHELGFRDKPIEIMHQFYYSYKDFEYTDTTSGYYENYFLDSFSTHDKSERISFMNEAGIRIRSSDASLSIFYDTEWIRYLSREIDTNSLNHSVRVDGFLKKGKNKINIKGAYFLNGFNKNDYYINSEYVFFLNENNSFVGGDLSVLSNKPAINYVFYSSNNFYWNRDLKNIQQIKLKAYFASSSFQMRTELSYLRLKNPVVLDSLQQPFQPDENPGIIQLSVLKNLKITRTLNWTNHIFLQKIMQSEVVRGPIVWKIFSFCFW